MEPVPRFRWASSSRTSSWDATTHPADQACVDLALALPFLGTQLYFYRWAVEIVSDRSWIAQVSHIWPFHSLSPGTSTSKGKSFGNYLKYLGGGFSITALLQSPADTAAFQKMTQLNLKAPVTLCCFLLLSQKMVSCSHFMSHGAEECVLLPRPPLGGSLVKFQGHSLLSFQTDCAACNLMCIKCSSLCSAAGTGHRCIRFSSRMWPCLNHIFRSEKKKSD